MGRISFFFILLCVFWLNGYAGLGNDLTWNVGTVTFTNQTEISGDLHLDMELGLLLIRKSGSIRTFPAFKVRQVEFFDKKFGKARFFISLPYKSSRFNQCANLFEIVLKGALTVLRKQQSTFAIKLEALMGNREEYFDPGDDSNYVYYVYDGKRVTRFRQLNKKRLTSLVKKYGQEVEGYVRRKNINLKGTYGRIKAIAYYNAVSQCKQDGEC